MKEVGICLDKERERVGDDAEDGNWKRGCGVNWFSVISDGCGISMP